MEVPHRSVFSEVKKEKNFLNKKEEEILWTPKKKSCRIQHDKTNTWESREEKKQREKGSKRNFTQEQDNVNSGAATGRGGAAQHLLFTEKREEGPESVCELRTGKKRSKEKKKEIIKWCIEDSPVVVIVRIGSFRPLVGE